MKFDHSFPLKLVFLTKIPSIDIKGLKFKIKTVVHSNKTFQLEREK